MFNKDFNARRGGIEASKIHENISSRHGLNKNVYIARLKQGTRELSKNNEVYEHYRKLGNYYKNKYGA